MDQPILYGLVSSAGTAAILLTTGFLLKSRGHTFTKSGALESAKLLTELTAIESRLSTTIASQQSHIATTISANTSTLFNDQHVSNLKMQTSSQEHLYGHLKSLSSSLNSIQAANTSIQELTDHVGDLKLVLSGPRTRGVFGEQILEDIVADILPRSSFSFQSSLQHPEGNIVRPDCVITMPSPINKICVDAKFPLDAYEELVGINVDSTTSLKVLQKEARKKIKLHLTKHIKDVSKKYVIPPVTSASGALLFLPSEAVFHEVVSNHPELLRLAHKNNVWICSPTTLMAVLTTMRGVLRDHSVQRRATEVFEELDLMLKDVDNLLKRQAVADKSFEKAKESLRLMEVSAEKVRRRGLGLRSLQAGLEDDTDDFLISDSTTLESIGGEDYEVKEVGQPSELRDEKTRIHGIS